MTTYIAIVSTTTFESFACAPIHSRDVFTAEHRLRYAPPPLRPYWTIPRPAQTLRWARGGNNQGIHSTVLYHVDGRASHSVSADP